jgi:hypothetical protein
MDPRRRLAMKVDAVIASTFASGRLGSSLGEESRLPFADGGGGFQPELESRFELIDPRRERGNLSIPLGAGGRFMSNGEASTPLAGLPPRKSTATGGWSNQTSFHAASTAVHCRSAKQKSTSNLHPTVPGWNASVCRLGK